MRNGWSGKRRTMLIYFGLKNCPVVNFEGIGQESNQLQQLIGYGVQFCLGSAHFTAQRVCSEYSIPFWFQLFYKTATLCSNRSWKAIFHCFIQVAQAAPNTFQIAIKQTADSTRKRTRIFSDKPVDFFDVPCEVSDVTSQRLECSSSMPVIFNRSYNTLSDIACFCDYADDIYSDLFDPKMTKWFTVHLYLQKKDLQMEAKGSFCVTVPLTSQARTVISVSSLHWFCAAIRKMS